MKIYLSAILPNLLCGMVLFVPIASSEDRGVRGKQMRNAKNRVLPTAEVITEVAPVRDCAYYRDPKGSTLVVPIAPTCVYRNEWTNYGGCHAYAGDMHRYSCVHGRHPFRDLYAREICSECGYCVNRGARMLPTAETAEVAPVEVGPPRDCVFIPHSKGDPGPCLAPPCVYRFEWSNYGGCHAYAGDMLRASCERDYHPYRVGVSASQICRECGFCVDTYNRPTLVNGTPVIVDPPLSQASLPGMTDEAPSSCNCAGNRNTWTSGHGSCPSYARGLPGYQFCFGGLSSFEWGISADGLYAADVCSECGFCVAPASVEDPEDPVPVTPAPVALTDAPTTAPVWEIHPNKLRVGNTRVFFYSTTLEECKAYCLMLDFCVNFNFGSEVCGISDVTVPAEDLRENSSNDHYVLASLGARERLVCAEGSTFGEEWEEYPLMKDRGIPRAFFYRTTIETCKEYCLMFDWCNSIDRVLDRDKCGLKSSNAIENRVAHSRYEHYVVPSRVERGGCIADAIP